VQTSTIPLRDAASLVSVYPPLCCRPAQATSWDGGAKPEVGALLRLNTTFWSSGLRVPAEGRSRVAGVLSLALAADDGLLATFTSVNAPPHRGIWRRRLSWATVRELLSLPDANLSRIKADLATVHARPLSSFLRFSGRRLLVAGER